MSRPAPAPPSAQSFAPGLALSEDLAWPAAGPPLALTYDDVLLLPQYSDVLPHQADTTTTLGRGVTLSLPFCSAAMDTVTEAAMAAALARAGGLGVLHKNASVDGQAGMVAEVKASAIDGPDSTSSPTRDDDGRLRVAAAVGVGAPGLLRAAALVAAGVDALVLDTAHGHSAGVLAAVADLRRAYPQLLLVAGNVATPAGCVALLQAGADVIKVGIGPGSICTTRSVSGVGVPQLSAVMACAAAVRSARDRGLHAACIADGGLRTSGDAVKALAAGADAVMVGSLLAGADEAPGEVEELGGVRLRRYRGMGSLPAMRAGSAERYFQGQALSGSPKLVAEGVEGRVRATGPVADTLATLGGGVRAGMGYLGAKNLAELRARAQFVRQSGAGLRESRVHDVLETVAEARPTPA